MIKPFGTFLLIKPVQNQTVLKQEDGTMNEYGEVLAVGDKCSGDIKVGDRVGFSVFGVEKLVIDDEKLYFVRENDEFLICTIV